MLLWIDGFNTYGTTTGSAPSPTGVIGRKYVTNNESQMSISTGRLSGYCLRLWSSSCYLTPAALTTNSTMVVGLAVKVSSLSVDQLLAFYDGTTLGVNLHVTTAGELSVYRGTTLLGTSSGLGLSTGIWYWLEFKVVCGSSGSYEVRLGTVNVLSASSVNTQAGSNAYHTTFRLVGNSASQYVHYDDLYCLDGSGSTNNTFLGNLRVATIYPDSAGDSTQFTPDSGSNYARVGETVADDDTSYVESATSGNVDLYNYGALTGVSGIKGVMVNTDCRETDATSFSLKTVCKSGSTQSEDSGQAIGTTSYVTKRRILETDPNTSAAWTKTNLEAAQFGVKVG